MVFVWGSRLFGKTDAVPGVFHVATKCGHCQYLPLIPMGTWLVFSEAGEGFRGVPIPFSFKSYAMAWLRVATIVTTVVFGIILLVSVVAPRKDLHTAFIASMGFIAGLAAHIGSYYIPGIGRATPAKMEALAVRAGMDMDAINRIRQIMMRTAPTGAFPVVAPNPQEANVPDDEEADDAKESAAAATAATTSPATSA